MILGTLADPLALLLELLPFKKGAARHWSHFANIQSYNYKIWAISLFVNFIKIEKYWPW